VGKGEGFKGGGARLRGTSRRSDGLTLLFGLQVPHHLTVQPRLL
jgi:hypothetical protein